MTRDSKPPLIVHVDLDGAREIFRSRGWEYPYDDDPIYESGLRNALDLFERNSISATFFAVSDSLKWLANRELVQEASSRGHEIASHSATHPDLLTLSLAQKRHEITESQSTLERLLGEKVTGFRAPGYGIDRECIEILSAQGYQYDSSAFPTNLFASRLLTSTEVLESPGYLYNDHSIMELPLPDHRHWPFPFSPSYSLLLGMGYFRLGLRRHIRGGKPFVLLFHLIDMADPLIASRLTGVAKRIFTLSVHGSDHKLARCQEMLDLLRPHYRLTTTRDLLREYAAGSSI